MEADELGRDRKAEAGAAAAGRALERREQVGARPLRHARAVVLDRRIVTASPSRSRETLMQGSRPSVAPAWLSACTALRTRLTRMRESWSGSASTIRSSGTSASKAIAGAGREAGQVGQIVDQRREGEQPALRQALGGAAIGEGRLAERDGATEGRDEAGRDPLHRRVADPLQPVGQELRRREHVAQLVIDLADREAELGQAALLAQLVGERRLHLGERLLGERRSRRRGPSARITREASSGSPAKAAMLPGSRRTGRTITHCRAK